ncbi:MAG: chemotaxis protein, partial [Phototrophicales bacterium]
VAVEKVRSSIQALSEAAITQTRKIADESSSALSSASSIVMIGLFISTLLAVIISIVITRRITGPVQEVVGVVKAVADGDLTRSSKVDSQDEIGDLAHAINQMASS